jgi:hypothetical protein
MKKNGWEEMILFIHEETSHSESSSTRVQFIGTGKGFNKENVSRFFDILEKVVDVNNIDALRIFNVDESGFSTVQKRAGKVLGKKGKHEIGAMSGGERGVNATSVCFASA